MRNIKNHVTVYLFLFVVIVVSAVFSGCDYITGEAIEIPETNASPSTPPWVWSASDGPYSIIVDRHTHEPIRDVTPDEALGIMLTSSHSENPVVIDVRTPEEYAAGNIPDAINIDYRSPSFRNDVAGLDKDKLYIVYCRTGVRSSAARDIMEEAGFKHVINMTGGYSDWVAEGLPVEQ
jgi:rhodanese-related sulfurtransferase